MFSDKVNVLMLSKVVIWCRIAAYCNCHMGGSVRSISILHERWLGRKATVKKNTYI